MSTRRNYQRTTRVIADLLSDLEHYEGSLMRDLGRLWRDHITAHRWKLFAALTLTFIWSSLPFVFTLTWRFLIDEVLLVGRERSIADLNSAELRLQMGMALQFFGMNMGLWSVWLVTHWTRSWLILLVGRHVVYSIRTCLHRKLQALHLSFFERTPTGRILSRVLDDVNVVHGWVTNQAVNLFASVAKLLIGFGLIFYLNWKLALSVIVAFPLYAWVYHSLRPKVKASNIATRRLNARMYARASERVGNVHVIQSFARERAELGTFARMVHDSVRVGMRIVLYRQALMVVAGLITAGATGIAVWVGVDQIKAGALTAGSLIAFLNASRHIFEPVSSLTNLVIESQQVLVVLRRVFNLLDENIAVRPGAISLDGMVGKITFEHVTFRYDIQTRPALEDITFKVKPGQRVAIMGPSGSGKTTLFQLLLRFYDPQDGEIRVGGVNLVDADPRSLRRHVRMVQQEPILFSGTIAENINYGNLEATPIQTMSAARQAELHDFVMGLPVKYETEVGENGITLSGGQKQRLALATALLTEPEVLLLDDTTSALDAETEARIRATLNRVLEGRTSLIITQRIATARDCDFIVVLDNGRIVQQGTHEELMEEEGFYRSICGKQAVLELTDEQEIRDVANETTG